jgi:CRISPR-associated protein Csm4
MTPYRLRLRLSGPTLSAWQADTIFGSLCWRLAQRGGERAIVSFLDRCAAGDPPIVLSDGFAGDRLPVPLLPPLARVSGKAAGIQALGAAKRERRRGYLDWDGFAARCRGEPAAGMDQGWRLRLDAHNTVSRASGSTGDEAGALFGLAARTAVDGLVTVYLRVAPDFEDLARLLWDNLAHVGFGRRASAGYGAFSVESWDPWPELDALRRGANGWSSLSGWTPAPGDPTEGWYRLRVKHGRVGEDLATRQGGAVFKRALLQIEAGSTFRTGGEPREWYGRLVHGIYDGDSRVAQSGFALAVGIHLPSTVEA